MSNWWEDATAPEGLQESARPNPPMSSSGQARTQTWPVTTLVAFVALVISSTGAVTLADGRAEAEGRFIDDVRTSIVSRLPAPGADFGPLPPVDSDAPEPPVSIEPQPTPIPEAPAGPTPAESAPPEPLADIVPYQDPIVVPVPPTDGVARPGRVNLGEDRMDDTGEITTTEDTEATGDES